MTRATPAQYADIRSGDLCRDGSPVVIFWLFVGVMISVVSGIVLIGWLAFSEFTRCDPCEWVQQETSIMGEWL